MYSYTCLSLPLLKPSVCLARKMKGTGFTGHLIVYERVHVYGTDKDLKQQQQETQVNHLLRG